jgi:predicted PurR-regulated permease PerM
MDKIPATLLRQSLLISLITAIAGLLLWNLYWIGPAVLSAYTLYVLLHKPWNFLVTRWKWPPQVAALALMLLSLAILALVLYGLGSMLGQKLAFLRENPEQWTHQLESIIRGVEAKSGIELNTSDNLKGLIAFGLSEVESLLGATLNSLTILLLAYFMLFFMLANSQAVEIWFRDWLPLKPENSTYLRNKLNTLVYSNALGIPFMGLVQGLAGLIIYWLLGIPDMWLWFMATCITGMLPVVGVALVYVPLSIILYAQGNVAGATFIFAYGFLVMGSVDNLARMWLLEKIGNTHPLITLLGVIAGIPLFGFIGLIFGPILVSLFLTLLKLYAKEFYD